MKYRRGRAAGLASPARYGIVAPDMGRAVLVLYGTSLCVYWYGLLVQCEATRIPDEQRLLQKLFTHYDNSVRPVYHARENVVVTFGLTLIQIMDMDEKNQVLVTNAWLVHEWIDQRFGWDPDEFGGLEIMRIPSSKLWLPDIVLYNNADDYTTGYMPSHAMVGCNGSVNWSPPARLMSSCKVITTFFPFDEQRCSMKFGSWTYDQAQVDVLNISDSVDLSNYVTNGEWYLISSEVVRNEVVYPISDAVYPDVTVFIVIRRRILYYVLNIIFPCVWMNVLSLLAFCLPPGAGEKITLGITVLLSYSVFMLLVAENMPPTSEFIPLISLYLTVSMSLTSFSIILTVMLLKIYHCGPKRLPVPPWIRKVVLIWMARIVNCNCKTVPEPPEPPPKTVLRNNPRNQEENSDACLRLVNDCNSSQHSPIAEIRAVNRFKFTDAHINSATNNRENSNTYIMEEMLHCLRILVAKRDRDDDVAEIADEWRMVTKVLDKCLLVIFMLTTLITTAVLFVFLPVNRYSKT